MILLDDTGGSRSVVWCFWCKREHDAATIGKCSTTNAVPPSVYKCSTTNAVPPSVYKAICGDCIWKHVHSIPEIVIAHAAGHHYARAHTVYLLHPNGEMHKYQLPSTRNDITSNKDD